MKQYITQNSSQTVALGERFAKTCRSGDVLAFFGNIGMGKTTFIKGLAHGLGITADVTSPTFSLVNEYKGNNKVLYHFDMYRINTWEDLYSTGFFDYLQTDAIMAIEWSENIENALPENTTCIWICAGAESEEQRIINIGSLEEYDENFSD